MWLTLEAVQSCSRTQMAPSNGVIREESQNGSICKNVGRVWGTPGTVLHPRARNRPCNCPRPPGVQGGSSYLNQSGEGLRKLLPPRSGHRRAGEQRPASLPPPQGLTPSEAPEGRVPTGLGSSSCTGWRRVQGGSGGKWKIPAQLLAQSRCSLVFKVFSS